MKCLLCECFSFVHICASCQETFLTPSLYKRKLPSSIEVLSFYKYKEIQDLLHTKHKDIGFYIYNILARKSFLKFAQEFNYPQTVHSVAVDDIPTHGYSHTAILNKSLESSSIQVQHNTLRAKNRVLYAGKSKEFRLLNPREFVLKDFIGEECILVDDIITTGSTLAQAQACMQEGQKNVLFCLTLADASL